MAAFVVYPYLKRFTWLCHFWLGAVDGLAPVGAWAAIKGDLPWQAWALGAAVAAWVTGFDLFYALFDVDVDREQGLHSWATRFGERGAFAGARVLHLATIALPRRRRVSGCDVGPALLDRRGDRRRAARLRALARSAGRPAPARRGVLHDERRDLARVLRLRARRRPVIVGLLHPGEMGAAVGLALQSNGHEVLWASEGRSDATRVARRDVPRRRHRSPRSLGEAEVILSICPPHAALDVAARGCGFRRHLRRRERDLAGARARRSRRCIRATSTAASSAARRGSRARRCISRAPARDAVAALFAGSVLEARVVANASALKMVYAAWSKGTAALLLAIREVARHFGVEEELARWRRPSSSSGLPRAERCGRDEGLALGRRDGGDRRHVRRSRRAGRLPPRRRRGVPLVISARGLAKRYGERRVFAGVDLELAAGGFLLVTGPNGSGKTTLLRVLAGLAAPSAGELTLAGAPTQSATSATSRSSTASSHRSRT